MSQPATTPETHSLEKKRSQSLSVNDEKLGHATKVQYYEADGVHDGLEIPTDEERDTLRRVPDHIPWAAYLIALVESRSTLTQLTPYDEKSDWECSTCVSFMDNAIDQLINIIANVGIAGGCGAVCGLLPAQWEATICMLACEVVGIEEFANLINDADPDPIWICMQIDICPINDYASGTMQSVTVSPTSGPVGTTFTLNAKYKLNNTTGAGEVVLEVNPAGSGFPFGWGGLIVSQPAGLYQVSQAFQATPQQNEPFTPGVYQVIAAVCEGSCGSIHSHSFTIAQGQTTFRITG